MFVDVMVHQNILGMICIELKCCGKKIRVGRFEDFEDAKRARIAAEKKYFGEFRRK